jgi:uncharacterized membrane protein
MSRFVFITVTLNRKAYDTHMWYLPQNQGYKVMRWSTLGVSVKDLLFEFSLTQTGLVCYMLFLSSSLTKGRKRI